MRSGIPHGSGVYPGVALNIILLPSEGSNSKIQGLGFFVTIPLGQHD